MDTISTIRKARSHAVARRIAEILLYALGRYDLAVERFRSRRALAELDDRLLRDIGLSRGEAQRECRRSFWD